MKGTEWMSEARCAGMDTAMFFPTKEGNGARAQAREAINVCRTCPVTAECAGMRDALGGWGVWAGRLYGSKSKPTVYVPRVLSPHGTEAALKRHQRAEERPCTACLAGRTA